MQWVVTDGAPNVGTERRSPFRAGNRYYTLATRETRVSPHTNKPPGYAGEHNDGFLSLYCWGGAECSLAGIPERVPEDADSVEYFAVDVNLQVHSNKALAANELRLELPAADLRGGVKMGDHGSDGNAIFGVFADASIRKVVPGQQVQLEGEPPITTQEGDIEVKVRIGGLHCWSAAIPHLMRMELCTLDELKSDAKSQLSSLNFDDRLY